MKKENIKSPGIRKIKAILLVVPAVIFVPFFSIVPRSVHTPFSIFSRSVHTLSSINLGRTRVHFRIYPASVLDISSISYAKLLLVQVFTQLNKFHLPGSPSRAPPSLNY